MLPAMCLGVAAMFGYFGLLMLVRADVVAWARNNFGADSEPWIMMAMIIPSIFIFLLPSYVAEQKAKRYSISCPNCCKDLTLSIQRILKTRCCSNCEKRIIETGRMRSNDLYARYCRRQWRNYLVYWFWAWPAGGIVMLIWHRFDSSAFNDCPQMIFLFGLIGSTATGWTLIRTNDLRYLAQTITSAVLLVVGISMFLQ